MEHVHTYTFLLIFVVSSKGVLSFFSCVRTLSTDGKDAWHCFIQCLLHPQIIN